MKNLAILIFLMFSSRIALADYEATGKIEWDATGVPGFLSIHATGGTLGCTMTGLKKVAVECKAHMKYMKTGKKLRDEHAKDYLTKIEIEKDGKEFVETYDWPSLKIKEFEIKDGKQEFTGELTVKKETKPIKGSITLEGLKGSGEFTVLISNYPSIGKPKYLGIGVNDDIKVRFSIEATKK